MMPKFWILGAVLCSCSAEHHALTKAPAEVFTIDKGTVERIVVADGQLASSLSTPVSTQRVRWYWDYTIASVIDEGVTVKKGDVILRLDPGNVAKDLETAKLDLETQELQYQEQVARTGDSIADAQADIVMKEFDLKKQKLLVSNSDTVSAVERQKQLLEVSSAESALKRSKEKLVSARESAKQTLAVQKLQIQQKKNEVKELVDGLDKLTLRAPQDGILLLPLFPNNAGWSKARPGASVSFGTTVAEVADPSKLIARAYIPEVDSDGLREGEDARITLDIQPDLPFTGKITKVSTLAQTQAEREGSKSTLAAQNMRQMETKLSVDALPKLAMPGMTVRVEINVVRKENIVRVPLDAIALQPVDTGVALPFDAKGKEFFVKTKDGDAKSRDAWKWQKIEIGIVGESYAEVIKGVNPGDVVARTL